VQGRSVSTATQLAVPVVFIQGANDDVTPTSLVREYFKKLHAPSKNLVVLGGKVISPFRGAQHVSQTTALACSSSHKD
jgi:fermentation-respiration switch protein FrsA (DUF1100 family)